MEDILNNDKTNKVFLSINEDINNFMNSNKFKFIGNLHQQIITEADNGNTVYNIFEIDCNILNNYKQYFE